MFWWLGEGAGVDQTLAAAAEQVLWSTTVATSLSQENHIALMLVVVGLHQQQQQQEQQEQTAQYPTQVAFLLLKEEAGEELMEIHVQMQLLAKMEVLVEEQERQM
jgi:altronate dehydratase